MVIPRKLYLDLWGNPRIMHSVIILALIERQALIISNYFTHSHATLSLTFVLGIAHDMCGKGVSGP
jgi:hypothetical protein